MDREPLSERAKVVAAKESDAAQESAAPAKRGFSDFIYHHKGIIALVIFLAILVGFSVFTFLINGGKSDIMIMYAGPGELYGKQGQSIVSAIRSVRSGENAENVELSDIVWFSEADMAELGYTPDPMDNAMALTELREELTKGDTLFFILSPELYGEIKESLIPLEEIFDTLPAAAADTCSVRLGDTDFYKFFTAVQALPADSRICLRRASDVDAYTESRAAAADELCRALMRDIVGFVSPETE